MRMRSFSLLVLFAALVLSGIAAAEDMSRLEKAAAKEEAKIADVWLDLAAWLADHGHAPEAASALASAEALDAEEEDVEEVRTAVAAIGEATAVDKAAAKKIEKAREKAAKGYDKLARIFEDESQDPRFAAFLLKALELDPTKRRLSTVADVAKKGLLLMRSPSHPFAAHVSLPKAWKPGTTWPVLVVVEGAGANHVGNARSFVSARGSRDWIVVGAHALSCTNEVKLDKFPAYDRSLVEDHNNDRPGFDVPGLLALLDYLHETFGAAKKVGITGFSGGGNLCYGFTLRHPDRVLAAAPACANFNPGLKRGAVPVEDGGPPVHIMTGEKDPHRHLTHGKTPPGIEEQTDWAEAALKEQGFTKVKRTMLDGVGHSPLRKQVWAFLDEIEDEG